MVRRSVANFQLVTREWSFHFGQNHAVSYEDTADRRNSGGAERSGKAGAEITAEAAVRAAIPQRPENLVG